MDGTARLLKVGQAAQYLGVSTASLRMWSNRGLVPAYRTPGVAIYGTLVGGIASGGAADTFDRIGRSPR